MKATEQYFPVVLFIALYKVDLTLESVDEILKCDHSAIISNGTVCFSRQHLLDAEPVTSLSLRLVSCNNLSLYKEAHSFNSYKLGQTLVHVIYGSIKSEDKISKSDYSNES